MGKNSEPSLCWLYLSNSYASHKMAAGINACRPHTGTGRCCFQFISSVSIYIQYTIKLYWAGIYKEGRTFKVEPFR
jgi:hypothetical protein